MDTSAQNITRRAYQTLRQGGLIPFFRKVQKKIIHDCFWTTCSIWMMKDLHGPSEAAPKISGFAVRFLENDRGRLIEWMKQHHETFPWIYFPKEEVAARENEHIFVSLEREGAIIGYIKVGVRKIYIHDFDIVICPPSNVAFVYDTFVLPEYRGQHLALYALQETLHYLREHQYEKLWCHIEPWNHASLRLFKQAGFKEKGRIRFSRIFSHGIFVRDGYRPLPGIEFFLAGDQRG